MPSTGFTVYSGTTCELPPPPVFAAPANGPITATECSADASSGNCPDSFFSSTVPSSAAERANAPSASTGIGDLVSGRSNRPNRIMTVNRRISSVSMVCMLTCPASTACFIASP